MAAVEKPPGLVEPNSTPSRTANRARFELELEFVQALANPFYLENLASEGLLDDPAFINYLKYLQYWRGREYARFIVYPHCLHYLDLLQHEQFRNELKNPTTRMRLEHYQFEHWRTWRSGPAIPPSPAPNPDPQGEDDSAPKAEDTKTPGRSTATPATSRRGSLHPGNAASSNGTPAP